MPRPKALTLADYPIYQEYSIGVDSKRWPDNTPFDRNASLVYRLFMHKL
jgi:hypothetical protein